MLSSQNAHPGFRNFTANDGLPSSEVFEILQDKKGYIWFATDNGVSRYNGYKFENYGVLEGLSEPVVFHLQEDRKGRVWMQCMSGKIFFFENDSIHAFLGNSFIDSQKAKSSFAIGIAIDSTFNVYCSMANLGLFKFSLDGKPNQLIEKPGYGVYQIENRTITYGKLNDLTRKSSIDMFLKNGTIKETFKTHLNQLMNLVSLYLDDGHILLWSNGYFYCFKQDKLVWQIEHSDRIISLSQNLKGEIFVGLINKGVRVFNTLNDLYTNRYESLLEGNSIVNLIKDREGAYWFAALKNGVFYCPNIDLKIYDKKSGLTSDYITSVTIKNIQEIYFGLLDGNLFYLNSLKQKIKNLNFNGVTINDLLYNFKQKELWISTPIDYYNGNNNKRIKNINLTKNNNTAKRFRYFPSSNEIWATYMGGFFKIDPIKKTSLFHSGMIKTKDTHYMSRTYDVYKSSSNKYWIGNVNGLFELKDNNLISQEKLYPAFKYEIKAIDELPDSTLVLGTAGYGLVFWKGNKIVSLTDADGMTSNSIENLHIDTRKNLWVGTMNGLNKINWTWKNSFSIDPLTTAHGLPSNEITDVTSWDDEIWVATTKGLTHFKNINKNPISPKVLIANILVNQHPLSLNKIDNLNYRYNNLTINYYAINFRMNGKIPYRYRINDGDWMYTFNTSLNFLSVPPGNNIFEIQAKNEDGIWSESSLLKYNINPPWWATNSARFLELIISLLICFYIYFFRIRQLNRKHQIQLQITQLEHSALQAQMNPHFIFNCLNSIQNYILQNEKAPAIKYLGAFASLVRSMLNASVSGKITLEEEIRLLNNYLSLEKLRFKDRFSYEIIISEKIDVFEVMIPPLLVQPFVENAIKHGISGKETGGYIEVQFNLNQDFVEVSIFDNGPGFIQELNKDNTDSLHRSFGMSITKNRLDLISKNNRQNTIVKEAIYNELKEIIGTKVIIMIKVSEETKSKFQAV